MLESPPTASGPASENTEYSDDAIADDKRGSVPERVATIGAGRGAGLLWWRHRRTDRAARKKRKKKRKKPDSAIRAARINQISSLAAVIVTGVVAIVTTSHTAQSASDSVREQIQSANTRSREEFLTKEQEGAYTEYMNALNDLIQRADVVSRALSSPSLPDRSAVSSSGEWKELHDAHQTAVKAQIKINFLSSAGVTKETDKIGGLLDRLEAPLMRFQPLDPNVEKELIEAEEAFANAARADLHADG
ncbi:hypothetical protein IRT45_07470 [Nocardia sp. BSTN01]|uniref:hypothetical protein n=1 Tax=Nocardia sp. BSTN01 TaxID=2783665 RepID=UPI0018906DBC|nr:hypothetical protein [Nocardia sp. BSTN01]MBF4996992.1 hypothetical protein [Nocardia sp. BSTN01]